MNALRKVISCFRSKPKLVNDGKGNNNPANTKCGLKEQAEQPGHMTNDVVKVNVTDESHLCNDKEIDSKLGKECTETHATNVSYNVLENKSLHIIGNKIDDHNNENIKALQRLLSNTSLSILRISDKKSVDIICENTSNSAQNTKDNDNSFEEVINGTPSKTETRCNNENDPKNSVAIGFHAEIDDKKEATMEDTKIFSSVHSSIETQSVNEQTKKCLKEFDEVFAKVHSENNAITYSAESFLFDDIDDIFLVETDDDSTYTFQDIKEIKFNGSLNKFAESSLETKEKDNTMELEGNKTTDVLNTLLDLDVISINSDDDYICKDNIAKDISNSNNINSSPKTALNNETNIERIEAYHLKENIRETQVKETLDIISISSDTSSEDDCGYHSSDFEFITEDEAKLHGIIVDFHPKKNSIYPIPVKQYFDTKNIVLNISQNDLNEATPSKSENNNLHDPYTFLTISYPKNDSVRISSDHNSIDTRKGSDRVQTGPRDLKPEKGSDEVKNELYAAKPTKGSDRVPIPDSPKSTKDSSGAANYSDSIINKGSERSNNPNDLEIEAHLDMVQNYPDDPGSCTYSTAANRILNDPFRLSQRIDFDIVQNDPFSPECISYQDSDRVQDDISRAGPASYQKKDTVRLQYVPYGPGTSSRNIGNGDFEEKPTFNQRKQSDGVQNDPYGPGPSSRIIENDDFEEKPTCYKRKHSDRIQNHPYGPGTSSWNIGNDEFEEKTTFYQRKDSDRVQNDPLGPGTSSSNIGNDDFEEIEESSETYEVPGEAQFINMFHAEIPGLAIHEIHFLEHKSLRSRAPIFVQYDGVGFDMNLAIRAADSDDEYRDEAEENAKKIYEMYPEHNTRRKKRRRH